MPPSSHGWCCGQNTLASALLACEHIPLGPRGNGWDRQFHGVGVRGNRRRGCGSGYAALIGESNPDDGYCRPYRSVMIAGTFADCWLLVGAGGQLKESRGGRRFGGGGRGSRRAPDARRSGRAGPGRDRPIRRRFGGQPHPDFDRNRRWHQPVVGRRKPSAVRHPVVVVGSAERRRAAAGVGRLWRTERRGAGRAGSPDRDGSHGRAGRRRDGDGPAVGLDGAATAMAPAVGDTESTGQVGSQWAYSAAEAEL